MPTARRREPRGRVPPADDPPRPARPHAGHVRGRVRQLRARGAHPPHAGRAARAGDGRPRRRSPAGTARSARRLRPPRAAARPRRHLRREQHRPAVGDRSRDPRRRPGGGHPGPDLRPRRIPAVRGLLPGRYVAAPRVTTPLPGCDARPAPRLDRPRVPVARAGGGGARAACRRGGAAPATRLSATVRGAARARRQPAAVRGRHPRAGAGRRPDARGRRSRASGRRRRRAAVRDTTGR